MFFDESPTFVILEEERHIAAKAQIQRDFPARFVRFDEFFASGLTALLVAVVSGWHSGLTMELLARN